jgi:hypothetical protein
MSQTQPDLSDSLRWITLFQEEASEVRAGLDASDAQEFETQLRQVAVALQDHPERAGETSLALVDLVGRYEYVDHWLQEKDLRFKELRNSSGAPQSDPAELLPSAPSAAGEEDGMPPEVTGEPVTRAAPPAQAVADHGGASQPHRPRSRTTGRAAATPPQAGGQPWTPESRVQLAREIFTAVLALVIIGFTLLVAYRSFNLVGDSAKIGDAKDILTIMLGLAGVVVGYYFGRAPGDARAAQATARADTAVSQREQVKATARSLADHIDDVIAGDPSSVTRSSQPTDLSEIRALRDQLRDLARTGDS